MMRHSDRGSGRSTRFAKKRGGVEISYINKEEAFSLEFSRDDRNVSPKGGVINGGITEAELGLLSLLKQSPPS